MELKSFVDDDVFDNLRSSLLSTGRGRPPALMSDIPINNKLLIQLAYLKYESDKPWIVIEHWLDKIIPGVGGSQSQTRLINLVQSRWNRWSTLKDSDRLEFLATGVDFDFISESLSLLGLTRKTFHFPPTESPASSSISNLVVIDLFKFISVEHLSKKTGFLWISRLSGLDFKKIPYGVDALQKKHAKVARNAHRDPAALQDLLSATFTISNSCHISSSTTTTTPIKSPAARKSCLECKQLKQEKLAQHEICVSLNSELSSSRDVIANLNNKILSLEASLESQQKSRRANQRQQSRIAKEQIEKLNVECCNLKEENNALKEKLVKFKKLLREERRNNDSLRESAAEDIMNSAQCEGFNIKVKGEEKNVYSDDIRKTAIALNCEAGVAVDNVIKAIQIVARYTFHYTFKERLPCSQTILNMCDEAYALNLMQVTESLLNSENCTVHTDGTSRDGKKFVGTQLSLDNGDVFYLGYAPVATENGNTLLDLTIEIFRQLSKGYEDISSRSVLQDILAKVTSTMTDRAAVNKVYDKKLQEFLQSEIGVEVKVNFLHCNAHFLLGLMSSCEKALVSVESGVYGRDKDPKFSHFSKENSATVRVIRMSCELLGPRGDQKNGCRMHWTAFCTDSVVPSFKSNRFNCFFEAACAIIYHYKQLVTFFTSNILKGAPNLKIQSLIMDLQDDILISYVCAIAVFYLKVSGPYWNVVRSSTVKYYDFYIYVNDMCSSLEALSIDPSPVCCKSYLSVFNNNMPLNTVMWDTVHDFITLHDASVINNVLIALFKEALIVSKRQLADFLPGGQYFDVDDAVKGQLEHCPLTNLIGESAFGDLDFDMSKRRNASLHNRSTVHCVKRNKTVQFLDKKPMTMQSKMLKVARRQGPLFRKESMLKEMAVKDKIRENFLTNQQEAINKKINEIEKNANILDAVRSNGGPCECPDDVDNLVANFSSTNRLVDVLKSEIRYQKAIQGKKLKFGPVEFMIRTLKDSFASNCN